ncbi:MAG: DUF4956 domain-containing protein [Oscillospiraceae bacterium]|nr:DUF4956 domain-containing protein [Oscillospiraceae bacterium]
MNLQGFFDMLAVGFDNDIGAGQIVTTLLLTFALSIYIFFVYRISSRAVLYSRNFNITMSAMSVVVAMVVMAIGNSPALSLGMVGALSIVRFRTAIKDPIDLLFLFWSIAAGLCMGAGMYRLAFIGSIAVAVVLLVLNLLPMGGLSYLLVVGCDDDQAAKAALAAMNKATKRNKLRSRSVTAKGIELTYEVTLIDKEGSLVNELNELDGVNHAALVAYDGEYVV